MAVSTGVVADADISAWLLNKGVNVSKVYHQVLQTKTKANFELMKRTLNRMEILEDGKVFDRKTGNGLLTKFIKRESTLETLEDKAKSGRTKAKLDLAEKRDEFNWIDSRINFQVWDSVTLEEFENGLSIRPYTERFGEAIRLSFMTQSLQPIPSYRVYSMKEAQAIADECGYDIKQNF
jgi:hypothetical protein